jgi:hypothetical protein
VSVASSLRSIITRSARSRVVISPEMTQTNIGDLTLLEKAVADHVERPLMIGIGKQPDRRIDVGQVMLRLRDLRLIGCDPPVDLPALVFQRLNNQRFCHDLNIRFQPDRSNRNLGAFAA